MNPRRLDIEAYRDTLLRSAGMLNEEMDGVSDDLDSDTFFRRTIYGRVSRGRMPQLLQFYDFPDATQIVAESRGHDHAAAADLRDEQRVRSEPRCGGWQKLRRRATGEAEQVGLLYRRILARDPTAPR